MVLRLGTFATLQVGGGGGGNLAWLHSQGGCGVVCWWGVWSCMLMRCPGCVCPQVEEMEESAVRMGKNISKLGRDIKNWPVWSSIKDTVDAFKRTMPLIVDLRNPAMRERHWGNLQDHIGSK